jgi:hypothetical protein
MWISVLAATSVLVAMSGSAQASYRDGTEFTAQCTIGADATTDDQDPAPYQNEDFCLGYIMAVVDASPCNTGNESAKKYPWNQDSSGLLAMQIAASIVRWLNNHPDKLDRSAALLIADAIQELFPCK